MFTFSPDLCHEKVLRQMKPALAFDVNADYGAWKERVREKFIELVGDMPLAVDLDTTVVWRNQTDDYRERRFIFNTEDGACVPCHLLLPHGGKAPYPLVICLQGHTSGMHMSIGRTKHPGDEAPFVNDVDYGLQAVREGYAVLCIEQRGFGERKCEGGKIYFQNTTCDHPSMVALLLGRTMIGERAWDVSRAIDAVAAFPEVDLDKIAIMGLSGGGTATYYTACLEPRIKMVMAAGAVCSFDESIGIMRHCNCNYIPRMAKYFDMGEVACMIAPRPLIVVAGDKDPIFRIAGTKRVFSVIEEIYKKEGAENNCKLIVGDGEHRFFKDSTWGPFRELFLEQN